jgi:hypothetical protein
LKKKYLSGIGLVKLEEDLDNTPEKDFSSEKSHSSSEHSHSSDDKPLTKPDGTVIVDYRRSKINKTDTTNTKSSHSTPNSNSLPTNPSHNKTSINSNHSVNNTTKNVKNETINVNKKPVSPVKPDYKRPSSISKIDYKRPSSTLPNTNLSSTLNRNTVKKSVYSSTPTSCTSVKKPEIPKKPLKRDSLSNLNSLKRSNSQGQFKSTIKKSDTLNRVTSPTFSTKMKDKMTNNTTTSTPNTTTTTTTGTTGTLNRHNNNSLSKKNTTLNSKKSNTNPLTATSVASKKEDNSIPPIPRVSSPLQAFNSETPVNNLYDIVSKYKKLNESPVLATFDKKVKRNTITLESKVSKVGEVKRSTTLGNKPTKIEGSVKRSISNFKEEQRISEKLDNLKKTLNTTHSVTKTSSLTKTIKEDKNSNATSEKKISTKSKIEDYHSKIANLNNAIENKNNKNNNVSSIKNIIESRERRTSTSSLKSVIDSKERKNIISNLSNTIETKNQSSTSNLKSSSSEGSKKTNDTNKKSIENKDVNAKSNNTPNLSHTLTSKERKPSVSNLSAALANKERKGSASSIGSTLTSKERKPSVSNLSNALTNKERKPSVSNLNKSLTNNERKPSISNLNKSLTNMERKPSVSNLSTALANKNRKGSISNLSASPTNKEKGNEKEKEKDGVFSLKSTLDSKNKKGGISNLSAALSNKEKKENVNNLKKVIESKNKKPSMDSIKSATTQNSSQPKKIISKENKFSSINPKNSLLFNTESNKVKDEVSKEENTLTETITETVTETPSIVSKSSIDKVESILPPTPIFIKNGITTISDQTSEATLSQNEEVESPLSSEFNSPTLNSSRKGSNATSSPALSNMGTINMSNFSSGGLKKKRSGWWDNVKDKNEEKQNIKESIRNLPIVNVKADEQEIANIDKPITVKTDLTLHKNSSVDSFQLNNLPESKYTHLINISDNKSNAGTPLLSPLKLDGSDEDIYKKSMNEIELLMNKAKLSDQNESILNALDVIIHFCKENGFNKTIDTLKEETKYYSNAENNENLKKYFESRSFDLAINYVKSVFSKYKPSDIPNYNEIAKSYDDMLYVLYRFNYINLIQKRKINEAKVKILNGVIKTRVLNSCTTGGNYAKYFEDDNFYLSELLLRGPLSASNPYKSFNMSIHLKQFWMKSYAEKEFINYWPFLEMFFNDKKDDINTVNKNHTSIPLNNLIKFSKGVQDVIDNCNNSSNANGILSDAASIKSYNIGTPVISPMINEVPKESPSARLKHPTLKTRKSDVKLSRTNSNDSFKSTNSLRSRLLRESSKSSIKLTGALPISLNHKTSNSSIGSDIYSNSFKSVSSVGVGSVGVSRTASKRINSNGLIRKTSQVFDEEATSNTKPIVRLGKARLSNMSRSNSAVGNYSTGNKRNSIELNDYHVNPRNSYHGGDLPNFNLTPLTHYTDDDIISNHTFSDNNSIYSLNTGDWLNFAFDGFIGPYTGGIRAMDVQYTPKKDGCGNIIDGVFGQLVVAVAIDSMQGHSISIWDVHTKTCLATMLNTNSSGNTKAVEMIKFHPHLPNIFLTSDQDFDVKLWDWAQGSVDTNGNYHIEPVRVWKKFHKRIIHKMDFLPNNPMYAISCSSDNTIQIWNINDTDKNNVKRIVSNNPISAFTFANNNQYLVVASMYSLRVYETENWKLINTIELEDLKSSKMTINSMETHVTNDNLLLLSCASNVILYDLASTSGVRVFDSPYISPDQKIEGHFSPYGQYVYSGSIIPKYFASLPTTDNLPNINNGNNNNCNSNNAFEVGSTCSSSMVNSIDIKDKEGTGFYLWNVESGRFEFSSIKQMERDVEPYLSSGEKVSVCQWINVPCINDPDTNAQIFILGTTDKVLRFYSYCDCHLTD